MLLHHVSENQIKELLKLKATQKPKKDNIKRGRQPKTQERRTSSNSVLKLDAKVDGQNTELQQERESCFLPKEKIKLPKKSRLNKPSRTYNVYRQITKYGLGKLIYINSK